MKSWVKVAISLFAIGWGGNEFTPLLVMYKTRHHMETTSINVLLFAYVLGIIPALLVSGPLSDRLGRKPLMIPAPIIAMLGSLIIGVGSHVFTLLFIGRVLSGVALGIAMAVGSSWIKELSSGAGGDRERGDGAKRAAMSLTAGFAIGAFAAGMIAQWSPWWPDGLPYLVNIAVSIPGALLLPTAVESLRPQDRSTGRLIDDLRIPAAGHRRFVYVCMPLAPWVFGAAASSYAVLPTLMANHVGTVSIAFSALICLIALGTGFGVQMLGRRIDNPRTARVVVVGLSVMTLGMLAGAWASATLNVTSTVIAAVILGAGYGFSLVAGLQEVQRIARPQDLAGLTAVFYCLTYLGFAVPALMAFIFKRFPEVGYPIMFIFGAIAAFGCLMIVVFKYRAHIDDPVVDRRQRETVSH